MQHNRRTIEQPTCESVGHVLLYKNPAFGCLDRDPDNDVLEKLNFVF